MSGTPVVARMRGSMPELQFLKTLLADESCRAGMELAPGVEADWSWVFKCSHVFWFPVVGPKGGVIVGRILDDYTVDVHIAALPHARGRIALRAARVVRDYLVGQAGYKKLVARVHRENVGSQMFVANLGFGRSGLEPDHIVYEYVKEGSNGRSVL